MNEVENPYNLARRFMLFLPKSEGAKGGRALIFFAIRKSERLDWVFVYQHEIVVRNLELGAHFTNFAVFCFFKYHFFFFLFNLHKQLKATLYTTNEKKT